MDLFIIFLRTLFIYFFILVIMRLMGKREIGKLSVIDLVVSIMIAEIAVIVIEETNRPLVNGLVPIATLMAVQILMAYASLKSEKLRHLVDGKPVVLVEHGQIRDREMARNRYNLDDLLMQLREKNVYNLADVEFAILEPSGKLSVRLKPGKEMPTREELGIRPVSAGGLPLPLIVDGKVKDENLAQIGQTRFWLKNQIQRYGAREFREVAFCSIDSTGHLFVDLKDPR